MRIERHTFAVDDVVAALFDVVPKADYAEVRVVGDEVIVDFVNPDSSLPEILQPNSDEQEDEKSTKEPQDAREDDQPTQELFDTQETRPAPRLPAEMGKNELRAHQLCEDNLFRIFYGCETYDEACRKLFRDTRAKRLQDFDGSDNKYKTAELNDVIAMFEAWKLAEEE